MSSIIFYGKNPATCLTKNNLSKSYHEASKEPLAGCKHLDQVSHRCRFVGTNRKTKRDHLTILVQHIQNCGVSLNWSLKLETTLECERLCGAPRNNHKKRGFLYVIKTLLGSRLLHCNQNGRPHQEHRSSQLLTHGLEQPKSKELGRPQRQPCV